MFSYNDLKIGATFVYEGEPYEILEYSFVRMQQRKAVAQTKMRNLVNGKVITRNFHQNESFEEAEIESVPLIYIYTHRNESWFTPKNDPKKRMNLDTVILGAAGQFLTPNTEVTAMQWNDKIIGIKCPIKMDLKIKETPPGERGNTAQGGTKAAELETGATIQVPLFVNTGDVIRVNTETGEYVERIEKNKE